MAAKSFRQDLWRTLLQSKMRFLSILAIVALGVGFFAGIRATEPNMIRSADTYYQRQNLFDFRLISPLGFQKEDEKAVTGLDGIGPLQAGYTWDAFLFSESGNRYTVRLYSLDPAQAEKHTSLNQLEALTGRLPQTSGEIVVEASRNVPADLIASETVRLQEAADLEMPIFGRADFRVVGQVRSPLYINFERGQTSIGDGNIDFFAYICASDFAMDRYNTLDVRTEASSSLQAYSDAYEAHLDPIETDLVKLGQGAMEAETAGYRQDLEAGKQELEEKQQQVEKELKEAQAKLEQTEDELTAKEAKLAQAREDFSEQMAEREAEFDSGQAQYQQGLLQYYEGYAEWLEGYNAYQDGREQLNLRQQELDAAQNQLDQGEHELELRANSLAEARQQLNELAESIANLEQIRQDLPQDEADLSQDELDELIEELRPYSENLADTIGESISPDDPGLLNQLRLLLDLALSEMRQNHAEGLVQYEEGLAAYEERRREIENNRQQLAAAQRELDAGDAELEASREQLDAAKATLDDTKSELDDAQATLSDSEQAINEGREEGEHELNEGQLALEEGHLELQAAWFDFEAGKTKALAQIEDAQQEIRQMERQVLELPDAWMVMSRKDQPGYSDYGDDARRIGAVASVFPFFFFLVACLVCLTTMTRMVEEERIQIGTLKAIGYSSMSISSKYIVYALAASFTGSVIGLLIGFQIFPASIMNAYRLLYSIPVQLTPFHFDLAVLSLLIAVAGTVVVTLLASLNELRATPATLMQPRAPKPGKRILLEHLPWFWRRLTFMQKLTARNLFRYKQRFFMTIIGIAGCTALLVTGFGLRNSVNDILSLQFDEIFIYDGQLMIDPQEDSEQQAFATVLGNSEAVEAYLPLMNASVTVQTHDRHALDATLLVPQDLERLSDFFTIRERESGQRLTLPPHGAVLTEKLADLLHIRVGDAIRIRDVDNRTYTLTVTAIAENYVTHFVYLSPSYFDQVTYRQPEYNSAVFNLVDPEGLDGRHFQEQLLDHEAVLGSVLTLTLAEDFSRMLGSLDYVVLILILSAGALAFVVLYNLTSINIEERSREIATIKVLGFRDREVSDYVFRENFILTLLGIAAGLRLGIHLHHFVMNTMETDALMFGQTIHWLSFLFAAALTLMFSILVNIFMHYRLRRIELVASLKSVE